MLIIATSLQPSVGHSHSGRLKNCCVTGWIEDVNPDSEKKGSYAIMFSYYCFKRLMNVSLLTAWPLAALRAGLVFPC